MTNRHRQKYISRLLIGLAIFTCGMMIAYYLALTNSRPDEWYVWVFASIMLINGGLLCLGSAIIHKVKSDLIRKQKQKDQTKKYEFE
jgi:hypothetical protein